MTDERDRPVGLPAAPPDPHAWHALPDDLFARVVPHVRRGLSLLEEVQVTPEVARLRAIPAAKLGHGRSRRRLLAALADGGPLWVGVRNRIDGDPDLVADLVAALVASASVDPGPASPADGSDLVARSRLAAVERARDDYRAQRDRARRQRDEARRQRDGSEGREASLRADVATLQARVDGLVGAVEALRAEQAEIGSAVDDAVAREARRTATEREALADDLAAARREVDDLRRARARHEAARATSAPSGAPRAHHARDGDRLDRLDRVDRVDRVVPGRPSRFPPGVRVDTREGAARLVRAVPRVLVDGYNVTRTHRSDLDLAGQRDWLVAGLRAMAARHRLDATVVFDAHLDGHAARSARGGVRVVYSHPGVTADDEIVLAVEVLEGDEPVVVVTDDRELRRRLAPSSVDLLPTASLVWLLG